VLVSQDTVDFRHDGLQILYFYVFGLVIPRTLKFLLLAGPLTELKMMCAGNVPTTEEPSLIHLIMSR